MPRRETTMVQKPRLTIFPYVPFLFFAIFLTLTGM